MEQQFTFPPGSSQLGSCCWRSLLMETWSVNSLRCTRQQIGSIEWRVTHMFAFILFVFILFYFFFDWQSTLDRSQQSYIEEQEDRRNVSRFPTCIYSETIEFSQTTSFVSCKRGWKSEWSPMFPSFVVVGFWGFFFGGGGGCWEELHWKSRDRLGVDARCVCMLAKHRSICN